MRPFIHVPELAVDRDMLQTLLETKTEWFKYKGTSDAPLAIKDVPDYIRKLFDYKDLHIAAGFVEVQPGFDLVPHEDEYILAPVLDDLDAYSWPDYYVDWMKTISSREWAISWPISGDFEKVKTVMYDKASNNELGSFTLDTGPVLFKSKGDTLHGVHNTSDQPRILFQLSFKGTDIYNYITGKYGD
jgi:hypothetical protein